VDESMTREMGRSALAATVEVDGGPLTVVTAHFKSKLISYARKQGVVGGSKFAPNDEGERLRYAGYAIFRRTGEAMTVRAHLDQLLADPADPTVGLGKRRAVVFCGDLNDEPDAATTQIVAGPSGSEIDLTPGSAFDRPDHDDVFRLCGLQRGGVATDLRPPLPRRDGNHPAAVGPGPAGPAGPPAAGADRPSHRGRGARLRLQHRPHLRRHFTRATGTTPTAYRRAFTLRS
jgi:hypothetical protein